MIKIALFLLMLLACCVESKAAEQPVNILNIKPGKAALEILYMGDPPQSVKEAVVRALFPEKSLVVELKEVYIPVKHESVEKEPENKKD